jgi:hypothetical protein
MAGCTDSSPSNGDFSLRPRGKKRPIADLAVSAILGFGRRITRQIVVNFEPWNTAIAPDVMLRLETFRTVQGADVDFDCPWAFNVAKSDLRTTLSTKLSLTVRG